MLKKYYNRVARRDEDNKDAGDKGGDDEFPPVENAFFIFGGATTNMTSRQRKRERREVFSVTKATNMTSISRRITFPLAARITPTTS